MKRMSDEEKYRYWYDLIQEFDARGDISASQWLSDHNVSSKVFYSWKKKFAEGTLPGPSDSIGRFVQLDTSCTGNEEQDSSVVLHKGDICIDIPSSVSDKFLMRILKAVCHA